MSKYAARDPATLEPHYSEHVNAMTAEKLHEKSAIAAELAYRDKRIAELEAERDRLRSENESYREALKNLLACEGDHMTACDRIMGATHPCTCGADKARALLEDRESALDTAAPEKEPSE